VGVLAICILYFEVFLCFFLSCKGNARVKLAKTGHGPHASILVVICVVLCIVCVYMCTVLLPPGDNPITDDKYIISYHKCRRELLRFGGCSFF